MERMVYVDGGSLTWDDHKGFKEENEQPQIIRLSSFYIRKMLVTIEEFKSVLDLPKSTMDIEGSAAASTWYLAIGFCNELSIREGLQQCYNVNKLQKDPHNHYPDDPWKYLITVNWNANGYRLPTEAEWEFAAGGGNQSRGYKYSGSNDINQVALYKHNSQRFSMQRGLPVGTKSPNELGIYDMSGNVWEWCWDRGDSGEFDDAFARTFSLEEYFYKRETINPKGPERGSYRIIRGGSDTSEAEECEIAYRERSMPGSCKLFVFQAGIRLVKSSY